MFSLYNSNNNNNNYVELIRFRRVVLRFRQVSVCLPLYLVTFICVTFGCVSILDHNKRDIVIFSMATNLRPILNHVSAECLRQSDSTCTLTDE